MRPPGNSRRDYVVLAVSLALAAAFIYAGVDKIQDRLQFADTIAAFRILPAALINLLALGLPPFEIACGLLLLGPPTRRVGALAVALVSVLYLSALSSALVRRPGQALGLGDLGAGAVGAEARRSSLPQATPASAICRARRGVPPEK